MVSQAVKEKPVIGPVTPSPGPTVKFVSFHFNFTLRSTSPKSSTINQTSYPLSERVLTASPTKTRVPLVFGEDTLGPILTLAQVVGNYLYLRLVWAIGECEEVTAVTLEDGSIPPSTTFTHYLGSPSDSIDPTLSAVITDYNDDMSISYNGNTLHLCYSVVKTKINTLESFPRFICKLKGLKIRDPRASTSYTTTAGLILGHLIENNIYGLGASVDDTSLGALATWNEEILDDGAGYTEPRAAIGLTIKDRRSVFKYIETLRGYAHCGLVNRGGVYYFIQNKASAAAFSITKADIIKNTFQLSMRDLRNVPNVVRVYYTDISNSVWRENFVEVETPGVTAGTEIKNEAEYTLNGFQTKTAALRFAYEKINEKLKTFTAQFQTTEAFYDQEEGVNFNLSHPNLGSSSQKVKLLTKKEIKIGVLEVVVEKEDDAYYSDEIADNVQDSKPTTAVDPFAVPTISGLTLTVETPQYQTSIYFSRIRATWNPITYPYRFSYKVVLKEGSSIVDTRLVSGEEVTFPVVKENTLYTVEVLVIGFGGKEGSVAFTTITPTGKDFPPSDVPNFIGYHFDGDVFLNWGQAADNTEVWYYQIQYGPASFAWDDVNSKMVIPRYDGNQFTAKAIPPGTWDFLIKAFDNAENQSTNAVRVSGIVVSTSSGSYLLADSDLDRVSSQNMALISLDWATKLGGSWNSTFPLAWNANYTASFLSYGAGLTPYEFITESYDVGLILTATWQIVSFLEVAAGSPTITIQLSDDDATWTDYDDVLSVIATGRYIRVKVTGGTSDRFIIRPVFFHFVTNVVTIDESFSGTTNASGLADFNLASNATAFESLLAQNNDLTVSAELRIAPNGSAPYTSVRVKAVDPSDGTTPVTSLSISARVRYI